MTSGSFEPWIAVLCGPTGSGKSTFAARVSRALECVIKSTDAQRYAIFAGSYPDKALWARSRDLVYSLVDDVVEKALYRGFSVVVDGVNSNLEHRARYLRHAPLDRRLVVHFGTRFDNTRIWAERGYDETAANEIRAFHEREFVMPRVDEAAVIQTVRTVEELDSLIVNWPFRASASP